MTNLNYYEQMKAIFSIKPDYAKMILDGSKKYEYRRHLMKKDVECVLIYASAPVCKVVGEFTFDKICIAKVDSLWEQTCENSGMRRRAYFAYFKGMCYANAYRISSVKRYEEPLEITDFVERVPQSFCYIND